MRASCAWSAETPPAQPGFLPISPEEISALGWTGLDVLLVSGDAYVDHPAFAMAVLGRWLIEHGFRVAVLPQPPWEGAGALESFTAFPRPRLFAGVSAGAVDSMLAHYSAFRKKRRADAYSPGGVCGLRPNRASLVYTGLLRRAFPGLPVILGGLEASTRRLSHYDFWSGGLRKSILPDSKADLLLCGMGEKGLLLAAEKAALLLRQFACEASPAAQRAEINGACAFARAGPASWRQADETAANRTAGEQAQGKSFRRALAAACAAVPGAATLHSPAELAALGLDAARLVKLHSHQELALDPALLLRNTLKLEQYSHQGAVFLTQEQDNRVLLLAPPSPPLSEEEMDRIYDLPYSRLPHPAYRSPIPAWEMVRAGITTHRGCGGGCSFCSLAMHQGRRVSSRSLGSILREAARIAGGANLNAAPKWAGAISDVGGPSANMWRARCSLPAAAPCRRASCLFPSICPRFQDSQEEWARMLRAVAATPGVRHVRVASGVRFDLILRSPEALRTYIEEYAGGQLKVAPEHISAGPLRRMRKPALKVFEAFLSAFAAHSRAAGKEQYIVPYLLSAFPGCTLDDMQKLHAWLDKRGWKPRQVQCFIPTPGTVATAMFYSGTDETGQPIYVAGTDRERLEQHSLLAPPASEAPGRCPDQVKIKMLKAKRR